MKTSAELEKPAAFADVAENSADHEARRPRIRILALFETATISGPAKNFFQFCRSARKLSTGPIVEFDLVTFARSVEPTQKSDFVDAARELEIPLHCIPESFRFDVRVLSHLRRLQKSRKAGLIETHAVKSHALVRASGIWRETPWVAFHHGYTNTSLQSPIYNGLDRWSLRPASQVVTMNSAFQNHLVQRGVDAQRITVLHNAVPAPSQPRFQLDDAALAHKKELLGLSGEDRVILCVGRLSREKAHIDMVAALQHLCQSLPDREIRLLIVGEGPEKQPVTEAIRSAGLDKNVIFAGQQKNVAPYYEAADVVAIPSLSEGSPNVLLEAMAYGVPVVATTVGGIPEIVTNGQTAWLVPPRNPELMAKAIDQVFSNPGSARELARRAREKVEHDYSPESRAKALINIYAQAFSPAGH